MKLVNDFKDYELLDMANGEKLERWGKYYLVRPDPQVIWNKKSKPELWSRVDAKYFRSNTGGGKWEIYNKNLPNNWSINYHDLVFNLKLMGFKHTGLFPEQAYNWNIIREKIRNANREVKVLNLFAYTGGASVAALSENAIVTHVDSSRGMVDWAKENVKSSKLSDREIHFMVDDCVKFVQREIRRGHKYDIIIMDPPSFGRGANKEVWQVENDLYNLVELCSKLLSDNPLMFLINSYTTGLSMTVLRDVILLTIVPKYNGHIETDEVGIKMKDSELILPCGIFARWEK